MDLDLGTAIIGALIGALTGGATTAWFGRKAAITAATSDLLKEWHCPEMRSFRKLAMDACLRHPNSGIMGNLKTASEEEQLAIKVVASFFERMSLLYKHNQVHKKMLRSAFGGLLAYWEPLLTGDTDTDYTGEWKPLIDRLRWLSSKTKSSKHPDSKFYR